MSGPFLCQSCGRRSRFPLQHRTLGWVCQHCLRPLVPLKRQDRSSSRVAALARYKSKPVQGRKAARRLIVAERDGWICQLCGEPVDPAGPYEHRASTDHIVRRRDGGSGVLSNLRLAHQSCNEFREGANVAPFAPPVVA